MIKIFVTALFFSSCGWSFNNTCSCMTQEEDWNATGTTVGAQTITLTIAFAGLKIAEKKVFPWLSRNWTTLLEKGTDSFKELYNYYKGVNNPIDEVIDHSKIPADIGLFLKGICKHMHKKIKETKKSLYENGKGDMAELVTEFSNRERGIFQYTFPQFDIEFHLKYTSAKKLVEVSDSAITSESSMRNIPQVISALSVGDSPLSASSAVSTYQFSRAISDTPLGTYHAFDSSKHQKSNDIIDLESAKKIKVVPSITTTDKEALFKLIDDTKLKNTLKTNIDDWFSSGSLVREVPPRKKDSSFGPEELTLYVGNYSKKKGFEAMALIKFKHNPPEFDLAED